MWEIITNNSRLFWVLLVLATTIILRFTSTLIFNFLINRDRKRSGRNENTLNLLKRVSIGFIYVLAVMFGSYALFEKTVHETISSNLLTIIWMGLVTILTIVAVALSQRYFDRKIETTSSRDKGDPTAYKFLNYFLTFLIYFIGICLAALAIPALQTFAKSALAGAGVLTVVIGVASQEALTNLVSGIFIVFFKPFRIGDCIRIGTDVIGVVVDLTLRHTVIRDFNNKMIVIPNSTMNKDKVTNYNLGDQRTCEWIKIGISYDSDINKALKIMEEEALKHPNCIDKRTAADKKNGLPQIITKVTDLGDSSVNLRAWVWAKTYFEAVDMRHDLYKSIKERFDDEGIEIPFPHRTLVFKNEQIQSIRKPLKIAELNSSKKKERLETAVG